MNGFDIGKQGEAIIFKQGETINLNITFCGTQWDLLEQYAELFLLYKQGEDMAMKKMIQNMSDNELAYALETNEIPLRAYIIDEINERKCKNEGKVRL